MLLSEVQIVELMELEGRSNSNMLWWLIPVGLLILAAAWFQTVKITSTVINNDEGKYGKKAQRVAIVVHLLLVWPIMLYDFIADFIRTKTYKG